MANQETNEHQSEECWHKVDLMKLPSNLLSHKCLRKLFQVFKSVKEGGSRQSINNQQVKITPLWSFKMYTVNQHLHHHLQHIDHCHLCAGLGVETTFTTTSRDWPRLLQLSSSPHLTEERALWCKILLFPRVKPSIKWFLIVQFTLGLKRSSFKPLFHQKSSFKPLFHPPSLQFSLSRCLPSHCLALDVWPATPEMQNLLTSLIHWCEWGKICTYLTLSLTPPWTLILQVNLSTFSDLSAFTVSSGLAIWPFSALSKIKYQN